VKRFVRDISGNVAIFVAIGFSALAGSAGIALLMVQDNYERTKLQAALDAGALAGTALPFGASDAERIKVAEASFTQNANAGGSMSTSDPDARYVSGSTVKPVFSVSEARVAGTASIKINAGLGAFVGIEDFDVNVDAQAEKISSDQVCVLALNASSPKGIEVYGNAQFNAHDCAAQANSDDSEGMYMNGNASASASMFGVTGNFEGNAWSPQPTAGIEPTKDPYADVPVPTPGICMDVASKMQQSTVTLDPGTYCGGLNIKADSHVTLNPGIYIMKDGKFAVNSGAVVRGEEVMIAFVGADSFLHLLSQADMNITSPVSGTYKNLAFMSDRDLSSSKHEEEWTTIMGGAKLEYDGVMYLPEQQIWVSGTAHETIIKGYSPTMVMVADKIWSQGNAVYDLYKEDRRGIGLDGGVASFSYGARLVK
jgi:hypothetical protein